MDRLYRSLFAVILILLSVMSSALAQNQEDDTIANVVNHDPRLASFKEAVELAGLAEMYDGFGPYTVFAPSNDAFKSFDQDILKNQNKVRQILLYHTLRGAFDSKQVWSLGTSSTAFGKDVTFENKDDKILLNGQARISIWDIKTSNGVIHIIEEIASPLGNMNRAAPNKNSNPSVPITPTVDLNAPPAPSTIQLGGPEGNPAYVSGGRMPHWEGISGSSSYCKGMTWVLHKQTNGAAFVGADRRTNPYRGDTGCGEALPMLCIKQDYSQPPAGYQNKWSFGSVRITAPIRGGELTSAETAHARCAADFGAGWRMAEFHDADFGRSVSSGWMFGASGGLPTNSRFWVYINDQPANPWNSVNPRIAPPALASPRIVESKGNDSAFVGEKMRPYFELQQEGRGGCKGTTFVIQKQRGGVVQVGGDGLTNPYHGDSTCNARFPVLCIRVDGFAAPPDAYGWSFVDGWSGGWVNISAAVSGLEISSRESANAVCSRSFGTAWKMAEWHDGNLGRVTNTEQAFWAYGSLPTGMRFWVAVHDQRANTWNQ